MYRGGEIQWAGGGRLPTKMHLDPHLPCGQASPPIEVGSLSLLGPGLVRDLPRLRERSQRSL